MDCIKCKDKLMWSMGWINLPWVSLCPGCHYNIRNSDQWELFMACIKNDYNELAEKIFNEWLDIK